MADIQSDIPTDPGAPSAYQVRVMQEAGALLGRKETEKNWGDIVELVASPFISARRLATFAPGAENAGKLLWCALFVSYCWWRAWAGFKRFADSECTDLWEKMQAQGWAWEKEDVVGDLETREGNSSDRVRDRSYHMSDPAVFGFARPLPDGGTVEPGTPSMADIVFFIELDEAGRPLWKDGKPKLRHVGLVRRYVPPLTTP